MSFVAHSTVLAFAITAGLSFAPGVHSNTSSPSQPSTLSPRLLSLVELPVAPWALMQEQEAAPQQPSPAAAPTLPPGDGKDLTQRVCTGCHSVGTFATQHHTSAEWGKIISDMVSRGLDASDDDRAKIQTYLATYLGPVKQDGQPATQPQSPPSASIHQPAVQYRDAPQDRPTQVASRRPFPHATLQLAGFDVPDSHGSADSHGDAHAGEQVFVHTCMQCHAVYPGQVSFGPNLHGVFKKSPRLTSAQALSIIDKGKGKMPGFGEKFTPQQKQDIIAYLKTL
jgi:mono/diheme cytochrome c family protein